MWRGVERRFSISAPQMTVRPHIAWYLRWGMVLPFVLAAIGLAWWAYDSGLELAGFYPGPTPEGLARLGGTPADGGIQLDIRAGPRVF